ncbi:MAG: HPF/RaiA family ribosome-associated protein [Phycisphaeraceae bacterium]|nr:MAG: HPF/RaiA family ribosome-associated protein [Phycisphaeraceae bacterium]
MQIQVNRGSINTTDAIVERIEHEVEKHMRLFRERVTRVEVHLHHDDGQTPGADKKCMMEARLAGHDPLAVDHSAIDMYEAITGAAGKLERAVRHKIERHKEHLVKHSK